MKITGTNSHTAITRYIRKRNAERRRQIWLHDNMLALTVSSAIVLGLVVSAVVIGVIS